MTRRKFILAVLSLASSSSIATGVISRVFLPENMSEETNEDPVVMRSGWILLSSDQ